MDVFVPERLILIREKLGISKAEAARRGGLSNMGYGRYESGERIPSVQTIEVMAQKLNTSVDYLMGKTDDPGPDQVVIRKADDPDMFEFISYYKKDKGFKKRIQHYLKELNNK